MTLVAKVIVKGKNRKKGPDNMLSKILKKAQVLLWLELSL